MGEERVSFEIDKAEYPAQREFSLAADPEGISPLADEIMEFIIKSGGGEGKEPEISLAVQEALANAVIHGAGSDSSKMVYCQVGCSPTAGVVIVVRDPGPGFDPARVNSPLSGNGLTSDHGRGVHLIRELMDDVKFERNGAQIRMWKK